MSTWFSTSFVAVSRSTSMFVLIYIDVHVYVFLCRCLCLCLYLCLCLLLYLCLYVYLHLNLYLYLHLHLHVCFIYVHMLLSVRDDGLVAACLGRAAERAPPGALLCCVTRDIGILGNSLDCGAALRQPDLLKSHRRSMLPRCLEIRHTIFITAAKA